MLPLKIKDIETIGKLFLAFEVGGNKFKNIVKLLSDTSKLMQCSISDFLDTAEIQEIINHSQFDHVTKFRHFKLFLESKRFPEKTKTQQQFQSHLANLELPPHVQLSYDPFFEKEAITLSLEIKSVEELTQILQTIKEKHQTWNALFDLTHGKIIHSN